MASTRAVTPNTTSAGMIHPSALATNSGIGVLDQEERTQLLDGLDGGLRAVRLVGPAEPPADEDDRDPVLGAPFDVVVAIAHEHRPADVDACDGQPAQRLADHVRLGAQRLLVEGGADDR